MTGWEAYDGNPSSCLLGEQTYYNDPEAGISDYQVAVDANGNELTGSDENSAWADIENEIFPIMRGGIAIGFAF